MPFTGTPSGTGISMSCSLWLCSDPSFAFCSLVFFGVFSEEAASFFGGAEEDCWAIRDPAERAHTMATLSENFTTDAAELVKKVWKSAKRDLIWTIRKGFCGIL